MIERYKKYEPLFGSWKITKLIGKGSFGEVYEIERSNFGVIYKAALKAISIPVDENEISELTSSGMSTEEIKQYIEQSAKDIFNEFSLMSTLKGNTNIVSYEDHQIIEHEDKLGWDILMKMELLQPVTQYIKKNGLTKKQLIRLGIDLCTALELCEKHNILHRDIKPENIFISTNGDFKLGDFGIARSIEKTTSGLSKKGTYTYMAPEVYKGKDYAATVDIYSLGIVMYKFMNHNRVPFMPQYPNPIVYTDREKALIKRVNGEKVPPPEGVKDEKLIEIVLKACHFDPNERYQNATDMKNDLKKLLSNKENDIMLIMPAGKDKQKEGTLNKNGQEKNTSGRSAADKKIQSRPAKQEEKEEIEKTLLIDREALNAPLRKIEERDNTKKKILILSGILLALIIALGAIIIKLTILADKPQLPESGQTAVPAEKDDLNTDEPVAEEEPADKTEAPAENQQAEDAAGQKKASQVQATPETIKPQETDSAKVSADSTKQSAEPQKTEEPVKSAEPVKPVQKAKTASTASNTQKTQTKQEKTTKPAQQNQTQQKKTSQTTTKTDTQQKKDTAENKNNTAKQDKPPEIYVDFDE